MEKLHLSITVSMLSVFTLASVTPAHSAESIDVGSRKQLFLDDRFIESSDGVTLVMNPPRRDGIVLLTNDEPWETGPDTYIGVYSSVIKENGIVRLWYDSRRGGDRPYGRVAYAESKDGLHFTKPEVARDRRFERKQRHDSGHHQRLCCVD